MKLYGVFFEKEDMRVDLMSYESKELASPLNYYGLTYDKICEGNCDLCFESTRKDEAMKFIRKNFNLKEVTFRDLSGQMIRDDNRRNKQPSTPYYKAKQATPINAIRNGMLRGNFISASGASYMVNYEQFNLGEYTLVKREHDTYTVVYRAKSAEDILDYLLTKARKAVDSTKGDTANGFRRHMQAQTFLKQVLLVIGEYERCHRLLPALTGNELPTNDI